MYSTTYITRFTPAVLDMVCRSKGLSRDEYRLGTLKRVETELANFLKDNLEPLHADDRSALEDLHMQVRLAIGDE